MNLPNAAPVATITPPTVRAFSTVSAAGFGQAALLAALQDGRTCLTENGFGEPVLPTWVGRVGALDEPGAATLPPGLAAWDSRATRLAWLGLEADGFAAAARADVARHGAARVGLALGTSASTIGVSEAAYRELGREPAAADAGFPPRWRSERLNTPHALAMFVAEALGIEGPAVTVSTACSSSAKVFALAERWLRLELVDAVVVGGVDALCQSVLYGFASLGLVSRAPCRPFDARRDGISVGEAAGFALLERGDGKGVHHDLRLLGHGEANDAHHMSSPHPEGLGAELAVRSALQRAALAGDEIDYVNLHGTATPKNDEVEAALLARSYGPRTLASATKGLTGHTMGAAGMLEAAICLLALQHGWVPAGTGLDEPDPSIAAMLGERLVRVPQASALHTAASHSFGFGGNNAVLVFGMER
jgi:3-oxoacyl-[acyl-carrier-protein] synthase-1